MGTRWLTAALLAALVATGCAGGESAGTTSAPSADPDTEAVEARDTNNSEEDNSLLPGQESASVEAEIVRSDDEETVNEAFVSPVFEALGFDPDDRQEAQAAFVNSAEELVRACMADAGFEYVPNVTAFAPSFARQLELNGTISPQQFTAEYGYGIATLVELNFLEDGVIAFVEVLLGPPPTEARSEAEQAAYELALSGETIQGLSPEDAQEQAFDNFGGQPGSCRDQGYSNADNTLGEKFDGLFTILGDEYDAIFEQIENDPRVRDLNRSWQVCMATFGHSYENSQEIRDELFADSDALATRFQSSPEALAIFAAAGEANLAAMDQDGRFDFLQEQGAFQGFAMVPSLQADLDALIQNELALAAHDAECSDEDAYRSVQLEFEQAFVEQHAEQLALIAAGDA